MECHGELPKGQLVFVMVADEILGGLRPLAGRAWTCDDVMLSCLGYANFF